MRILFCDRCLASCFASQQNWLSKEIIELNKVEIIIIFLYFCIQLWASSWVTIKIRNNKMPHNPLTTWSVIVSIRIYIMFNKKQK